MSNIKQCLEQCLAHGKCSINVSHCSYFCNPEYRSYVSYVSICVQDKLASSLSSTATRVNHVGMAWQRTVLVPSACQLLVPKGGWFATFLLAAFWTSRRILRSLIFHLCRRGGDTSDGLCPGRSTGGKETCPPRFCSFLCLCTWVITIHSAGAEECFNFFLHWIDLLYLGTGLIVKR